MRSFTSDHRTPLAWRHRDITLQSPSSRSNSHHHMHSHHRAPPTPSETTSTSADEREEVPMVRNPHAHHHNHHSHHHRGHELLHHHNHRRSNSRSRNPPYPHSHHSQFFANGEGTYRTSGDGTYRTNGEGTYRTNGGTLRSTRSVPALALATWDGEPCPVHGHGVPLYPHPHLHGAPNGSLRRHGSLFDVRGGPFYPPPPPHHILMGHYAQPPPPPPPMLDKKSFHGSLQLLSGSPFPPHLLPPLMRPRPFVYPAGTEPLPVRDPFKSRSAPSPHSGYAGSKGEDPYSVDQVCCKGHLIVLWIILAVVTIGVVLGIVLGVTIA